jgi:signal transduction histidine kinase
VYFPDLIADQIRNTGVLLRDKPVRLAVDVPRGIEWLSVDGARLRQVLASLLSNAAKFTAGGEIRVAARLVHASPTARASDPASLVRTPEPEGDILEISIADTGRGISPSDQQLIFEAFRQVDPSSTRIHEGIGIGLAIVREMSRLLGASIDLESTAGEGTKFSLRLPVTAVEGPAGRSAELGRSAVKPREPRVRDARGLLPELAQLLTASAGSRADAVAFTLDFLDRILRPEVTFFAEPAGSGWKISDVVDHAGHGLVPGGSPPLSSETLEELPTERRAIVDDPRGEGEPSWSAVAVPGERGRPSGVLAICMRSEPVPDPESLRLLEVVARWLGLVFAYERLGEVRDEIIASVGRELKNPLGALLAYTQVLLRGLRGPLTAEQRPVALRLERTLHRAILSALDLLDFRRIESRGLEVEQRPFSLAMVIDHVLSRHGAALELGGYRIGREIAAGLPQCLGDEIRTDRALSNLLRAVIERLPDGSELGIRASAAGHEVSCELSAVVTETAPFVETLAGERRPIEVTPTLGLRLARAWIETQGGQVELAAHSGIVIRFSLPSAPPDEPQGV